MSEPAENDARRECASSHDGHPCGVCDGPAPTAEIDAVCEALARLKSQADAMTNHGQNMQRYDIEVSVPLLHSADVMHKCYEELVAALAPSETRVIPPGVEADDA